MYQVERRDRIVETLNSNKSLSVKELCKELGSSPATIRRDLIVLSANGLVLRSHGGAVHPSGIQNEIPLRSKRERWAEEKNRIAEQAAQLVKENDIVALNGGTTTLAVAKSLRRFDRLTLVTNSIEIVLAIKEKPNFQIILIGGILRSKSLATGGMLSSKIVNEISVNHLFLGVTGIDDNGNCWVTNESEASVEKEMIRQSSRVYILADHSKFNQRHLFRVVNLADVTGLITDSTGANIAELHKKYEGVEIHVA